MLIADKEFHFLVASDIQREGLCWECYCKSDGVETLVLEVFRNDTNKCFEVNQFAKDLPFELFEYVIGSAKEKLGNFSA